MGRKGKPKVEPPGVSIAPKEQHAFLLLQVDTLERELQVKSAEAEEALRSEVELRAKVDRMEDDFKQEQSTTFAVTADMARQYKALQEELIYKINSLETQLTEQKEELDITNHELKELTRNKMDDIEYKEEQIKQLNDRMSDMSHEFENMLSETLQLMKEHISDKLDTTGDDAGKDDFTQRLKTYSDKAYEAVSVNTRPGGATTGALTDKGGTQQLMASTNELAASVG